MYAQIRKPRDRHRSGPISQPSVGGQISHPAVGGPISQPAVIGTMTQLPAVDSIDVYKANSRGLINNQTGEVTIPHYGVTMLIDDAIIQGM